MAGLASSVLGAEATLAAEALGLSAGAWPVASASSCDLPQHGLSSWPEEAPCTQGALPSLTRGRGGRWGGRAVPQPGAEAAVRSQGVASGQPASEELRGPQERGLLQTWTARDSALWASRNAAPVGRSTCYVSFGTSSLSGPLGPVSRRVGGTASEPEGRAVCPPGSGRAAGPGASWPCPCSVGSSATRLRGPCGQLKARRGRVVTSPHVQWRPCWGSGLTGSPGRPGGQTEVLSLCPPPPQDSRQRKPTLECLV